MLASDAFISYRKTNCYGHPTHNLSVIVKSCETLMTDECLLSIWKRFLLFLLSVLVSSGSEMLPCHSPYRAELACQHQTQTHLLWGGIEGDPKQLGRVQRGLMCSITQLAEARKGVCCEPQCSEIHALLSSDVRLIQNGAVQLIQRPS